jgi:hypothetical protein
VARLFILAALMVTVLAAPAFARQGEGGFAGRGGGDSGLPADIDGPRTIPQQFAARLKLDKTQSPLAEQVLSAAASEAAPHVQQMLQARQRMVNAARANRPDDVKAAQEAYETAAAQVAGIEASVLARVLAVLKPNQQKNAPEAFALIAGLFSNPPPIGGGRGGRRGSGGER